MTDHACRQSTPPLDRFVPAGGPSLGQFRAMTYSAATPPSPSANQ